MLSSDRQFSRTHGNVCIVEIGEGNQCVQEVHVVLPAKFALPHVHVDPHVFEKALWSELGFGEPMQVIRAANEEMDSLK